MGGPATKANLTALSEKTQIMTVSEGGKVIEGMFDGQNMVGPDNKQYPVPANYASKSKLVEGDVLKLTISDDGSFIYKQIGPVERDIKRGVLVRQSERDSYAIMAEGVEYNVLKAAVTYYKGEPGDEAIIYLPRGVKSRWAALYSIIKVAPVLVDAAAPILEVK